MAQSAGSGRFGQRRRAVLTIFATAGLVLPGLILDARWMATTPTTMPSAEARLASLLPAGATVQGDLAPLLAMTARVTTIVVWPGGKVNAGDLYSTRNVRWVVGVPGRATDVPAAANARSVPGQARRTVACAPWVAIKFACGSCCRDRSLRWRYLRSNGTSIKRLAECLLVRLSRDRSDNWLPQDRSADAVRSHVHVREQ